MQTEIITKFKFIFEGLEDAYGLQYAPPDKSATVKVKGKIKIVREEVTDKLWESHLEGKNPSLGIIPINRKNLCSWGCIDIDDYPFNHTSLVKKINKLKLPLIVFRSKSGGAHIFLFTTNKVSAELMRNTLIEIAAVLGYANKEIFPKQISLNDPKDVGNFLNMPYHGGNKTTRYAFTKEGKQATLEEFMKMYGTTALENLSKLNIRSNAEDMYEGPPCLQTLCANKVGEGQRNEALYNMGVYARKFDPDRWENLVDEYNYKYMSKPLGSKEVESVKKSLVKKDYFYKCTQQPIVSFCNKALCRTRKYGIGGEDRQMPILSSLAKYDTAPPIWFLNVDGQRLELDTDEIQMQTRFQKKCIDALNHMPPKVKDEDWRLLINGLMDEVTVIPSSGDSDPLVRLQRYLKDFCTNRTQGKVIADLKRGVPVAIEGEIIFLFENLWTYLTKKKWDRSERWTEMSLTNIGAKSKTIRIDPKTTQRVRVIQMTNIDQLTITLPKFKEEDSF
jgi:hypothetical protein